MREGRGYLKGCSMSTTSVEAVSQGRINRLCHTVRSNDTYYMVFSDAMHKLRFTQIEGRNP